ncbi:hypothetical protein AeNC1_013813 [Aphanomyces euteiches]|nr:hypothetical protein AeNC1_013813 [Aphanomyces euteiches]
MAITFRNVFLEDEFAAAKTRKAPAASRPRKGKKKKKKRQRICAVDPSELKRAEETIALEQQLHDEMDAVGMAGMLPLSFGSSKRTGGSVVPSYQPKPPAQPIHLTFDENGHAHEVAESTATVLFKHALEEEENERPSEPSTLSLKRPLDDCDEHDATKPQPPAPKKPAHIHPSLQKYWAQRYALFSKFDHGIKLDHEGWFSVTPEVIARHHAERIACDVVVDAFTGCGGNAIQLAQTCRQVIAIDMDPEKITIAKHNAAVYGVDNKIEWIIGDAFDILPHLQADVVFLSPPWGGPEYLNQPKFSLEDMRMGDHNGIQLYHVAAAVTKNIVYFVPRNTDTKQIKLLTEDVCEVEYNHLNNKLKTVTIYFGDLACQRDLNQDHEEDEDDDEET